MDLKSLIKIRKDKKITQEALAKRLGITRALLIKYERGESSPRTDLLNTWCDALGMEISVEPKPKF